MLRAPRLAQTEKLFSSDGTAVTSDYSLLLGNLTSGRSENTVFRRHLNASPLIAKYLLGILVRCELAWLSVLLQLGHQPF